MCHDQIILSHHFGRLSPTFLWLNSNVSHVWMVKSECFMVKCLFLPCSSTQFLALAPKFKDQWRGLQRACKGVHTWNADTAATSQCGFDSSHIVTINIDNNRHALMVSSSHIIN